MPSRRRLLTATGTAASVALAGCAGFGDDRFSPGSDADTDWPMPRADAQNTAFSPDAAAPREGATERWTYDAGFDVRTPVVADGTAFVPTAEALVALDTTDGTVQWRFAPDDQPWPAPPVVHGDTVFTTASDGDELYALDAETGDELWTLDDDDRHVHARPHLLAGRRVDEPPVLVGDDVGRVTALAPTTGTPRWTVDLFGDIRAFAYRAPTLFVGTSSGEVSALLVEERDRPRELWRRQVDGAVEGIVPTANGVAVSSFGGALVNLNGDAAGAPSWTAAQRRAGSTPVYAGSWFYSVGYDAASATRTYDGEVGWRASGSFGSAPPVAAGDTLYVAGEEAVHAFDLDGGGLLSDGKRFSYPVPGGGIQGLAVADGALFVARQSTEANGTTLYCVEPN